MSRTALILPFALSLLTACDEPSPPSTDLVTDRSGPFDPCQSLTPQRFEAVMAAIDAASDMMDVHYNAHGDAHFVGVSAVAIEQFDAARDLLDDQYQDILDHDMFEDYGYLTNATRALGTFQVTVGSMAAPMYYGNYRAGLAAIYEASNEAQAAALLGFQANQRAQSLGADSLACYLRGTVTCGNGTVDTGEACDDGNLESGDGCSLLCEIES